jgi:type I restriction enzyme S subunit
MSDWLVPKDWCTKSLKMVSSLITDGAHFSPIPQDEGELIANVKDMQCNTIDYDTCTRITKEAFDLLVAQKCSPQKGDVLLSKDGTIGRVVLFNDDRQIVLLSSIAIIRTASEINPCFLKYMLSSFYFEQQLYSLQSGSALKRITVRDINRLNVSFPSLPQQRKIARILTTVDNLIEKTEALIAKYQAIKQGMMQDLFTRGVNEHGRLRPPYEEAPELYKQSELGWIPKEWRESTVGNELLGIDAGKSPDCPDIPAPPGEWGVLKVSAVQPDGFRSTENKVVRNPVWINPAYEVKEFDLLISRSNTHQLVGLVCLVHSPQQRLMICDKTLRLRFNPREAAVSFMFWLFQHPVVRRHIEVHATGTSGSMKNISQPVICSARIMMPPFEEQERITNRIEAIQDNIAAQRRTQEKLMIEKTGLMQDLLTGKVRVKVDEGEFSHV